MKIKISYGVTLWMNGEQIQLIEFFSREKNHTLKLCWDIFHRSIKVLSLFCLFPLWKMCECVCAVRFLKESY